MGRRGEDRVVDQILPVAGELLAPSHLGGHALLAPASGCEHHLRANPGRLAVAKRQRRNVEAAEPLHQAEPAVPVVGHGVPGDAAAVARREPYGFGLGDEIADRQEQVLADMDRAAGALRPERAGGKRVFGHQRAQADHGGQCPVQVKGEVAGVGLQLPRYRIRLSHGR